MPAVPGGAAGRAAFGLIARHLRRWDVRSTKRVDVLIANSVYTRERIQRVYGRDAAVLEPPVDLARFAAVPDLAPDAGAPTYLCVLALVPYKRVELAVRAFATRAGARPTGRRRRRTGPGPAAGAGRRPRSTSGAGGRRPAAAAVRRSAGR